MDYSVKDWNFQNHSTLSPDGAAGGVVSEVFIVEQEAVVPPFIPWHVQAHGPFPVTEEGAPAVHRLLLSGP